MSLAGVVLVSLVSVTSLHANWYLDFIVSGAPGVLCVPGSLASLAGAPGISSVYAVPFVSLVSPVSPCSVSDVSVVYSVSAWCQCP